MKNVVLFCLFIFSYTLFSQSLTLFDVDATNFPIIKAKFFAFDRWGNQITNLSPSDFELKENGVKRNVTLVSCPTPRQPEPISSVLVIDVSGSMGCPLTRNIELAKEAGKAWVNGLPSNRPWECAITAFDDRNYLIKDFTNNKQDLLLSLENLKPGGGTNYDAALIDLSAGGIHIVKTGKHKKCLVFLSDGMPDFEPQTWKIIQEARNANVTIYGILLGNPAPKSIREICERTGGLWFENIKSLEEAKGVFLTILQLSLGVSPPCDIRWQSDVNCSKLRSVEINCIQINTTINFEYTVPENFVSRANFSIVPNKLNFGPINPLAIKDTTIEIVVQSEEVNFFQIQPSNPRFVILDYGGSAPPFKLSAGQRRVLTIRYFAQDSNLVTSWLDIQSDACFNNKAYLAAGFRDKVPEGSFKLIQPNGYEVFLVGKDTNILWEGILPDDTVSIEYSTDAGTSWYPIVDKATGLNYEWKNIPNTPSRYCLAKIKTEKKEEPSNFTFDCSNPEMYRPISSNLLLNDDFESYRTGTFPSQNGWYQVYSGANGAVISETVSHSGRKSIRLQGRNLWSNVVLNQNTYFSNNYDYVGFECYIYLTGNQGEIAFYDPYPIWGGYYGRVLFDDGYIKVTNLNQEVALQRYNLNRWYKVNVVLGKDGDYCVGIDDQYYGKFRSRVSNEHSIFESAFTIVSGHAGSVIYFDDVKVWKFSKLEVKTKILSDVSDNLWSIVRPEIFAVDINFDTVCVNSFKDTLIVSYIRNNSDVPVIIKDISITGPDASNFYIVSGLTKLPTYLQPRETINLEIGFHPTRVGLFSAEINIYTPTTSIKRKLTGMGANKKIELKLTSVTFQNIMQNKDKDTTLIAIIENKSKKAIKIYDTRIIGYQNEHFQILSGGGSFVLNPNESRTLIIKYSPKEIGRHQCYIQFLTKDDCQDPLLEIFGNATPKAPILSLYCPNDVDTSICFKTILDSIKVINKGSEVLKIYDAKFFGQDSSSFNFINSIFPIEIEPEEAKFLVYEFKPKRNGEHISQAIIFSNSYPDSLSLVTVRCFNKYIDFRLNTDTIDLGFLCPLQPIDTNVVLGNFGNTYSIIQPKASELFEILPKFIYLPLDSMKQLVKISFRGQQNEGSFFEKILFIDTICNITRELVIKAYVENSILLADTLEIVSELNKTQTSYLKLFNPSKRKIVIKSIDCNNNLFSFTDFKFPIELSSNEEKLIKIQYTANDKKIDTGLITFYLAPCEVSTKTIVIGIPKFGPEILTRHNNTLTLTCSDTLTDSLIIYNKGSDDLIIYNLELNKSDSLQIDFDNFSVPFVIRQDSFKVLHFRLTVKYPSLYSFNLKILSNVNTDSILTLYINVKKEVLKFITSVDTIDLGNLCINQNKDTVFSLKNTGTLPLYLKIKSGNFVATNTNTLFVDTNVFSTVKLYFNGLPEEQEFFDKILIEDTTCGYFKEVLIKGKVVLPKIYVENLEAKAVYGSSANLALKIHNVGSREMEIVSITGVTFPFELLGPSLPIKLDVNETIELTIRYTPNDKVNDSISIQIYYLPCDQMVSVNIVGLPLTASATLSTIEIEGTPGDRISIPIILSKGEHLLAAGVQNIDVDLEFNPTLLYPVRYPIERIDEKRAKIRVKDLPINQQIGTTIGEVECIVGLGNEEKCELILSNPEIKSGVADVFLVNGQFRLKGICREGGARLLNLSARTGILNIMPNPAEESFDVEVSIGEVGFVEISLLNLLGEKVKNIIGPIPMEQGKYNFRVNTSDLNKGLNILQLRTPSVIENKIIIIR